jgi:hypothetical protein
VLGRVLPRQRRRLRRAAFYQGEFDPAGTIDINPVTWHELAERGLAVRGEIPEVHTDRNELLAFTRNNLATFWSGTAEQVENGDLEALGGHDESVAFLGLGPARLHHLLATKELTSKSGAGRYVRDRLDPRESLRIRENPRSSGLYEKAERRGRPAAVAGQRRRAVTSQARASSRTPSSVARSANESASRARVRDAAAGESCFRNAKPRTQSSAAETDGP